MLFRSNKTASNHADTVLLVKRHLYAYTLQKYAMAWFIVNLLAMTRISVAYTTAGKLVNVKAMLFNVPGMNLKRYLWSHHSQNY